MPKITDTGMVIMMNNEKIMKIILLLLISFNLQAQIHQSWYLHVGRNLWSTYCNIEKFNKTAEDFCWAFIVQDYLIYMEDQNGNRYEKVNGKWVDNIGLMSNSEGYILNVNNKVPMNYSYPSAADLPDTIHLRQGKNIIGVPVDHSLEIRKLFVPVWDKIVYIENEDFEVDYFGEEFEFEYLWPGYGYFVICKEDCEIIIGDTLNVLIPTSIETIQNKQELMINYDLLGRKLK